MKTLDLRPATDDHLEQLMEWFPDAEGCARWGGPKFRHPFTAETFREDAYWGRMPGFVLAETSETGVEELLAFGQIYPRDGRCQLARLAVSPAHRGRGLGARLIRGLMEIGGRKLGTDEYSLFVRTDNDPAVGLYRKLGFRDAPWPEDAPELSGVVFMTKSS